jgi:type I restriction enzyme M protein
MPRTDIHEGPATRNRLREQDIKRIVDVWNEQQPVPSLCTHGDMGGEIEQNDFT